MTALDDRDVEVATKRCSNCVEEKPFSEFNKAKKSFDGFQVWCKKCMRKASLDSYYNKKRNTAVMSRADKFKFGHIDSSELTDEELFGGFIYQDDGTKYESATFQTKTASKFQAELNRRLNKFIKEKSYRAIQVVFEIADSDLVEPADRLKAATWLAERVIGKTPEKLELNIGEQPHESIFENIISGSRDEHRKALGNAIDAEVIEDGLDEPENNISNQNGIIDGKTISESEMVSESNDKKVRFDNGQLDSAGISVQSTAELKADEIVQKRDEAKELKKRIADAKKRRFAARATGATDLASAPWLIDWRVVGSQDEGLVAHLVAPVDQTPKRLAVIASNDSATDDARFIATQRANMLAAQAEAVKRKIERLRNNGK